MASSNRHWPSMFKSKPCNNNQLWPQHNLEVATPNPSNLSNSSPRPGCEERSPEPKPRWNPRPEQIRILESIFNSGMVNPPRDEIRRIRTQLQEFGQVGDANVFYWFQNRKSRSKHKQRTLQAAAAKAAAATTTAASSSSSSTSSEMVSPKNIMSNGSPNTTTNSSGSNSTNNANNNNNNVMVDDFGMNNNNNNNNNSPTSINQGNTYFHQLRGPTQIHAADFVGPSESMIYFPGAATRPYMNQGLGFSGGDGVGVPVSDQCAGVYPTTLFLGDMIGGIGGPPPLGGGNHVEVNRRDENLEKFKYQEELGFMVTNPTLGSGNDVTTCAIPNTSSSCPISSSNLGQFLGIGDACGIAGKPTVMVFIDEVPVEVPAGLFNVKEAFGGDAMLVHPTGHPVLSDEWGVLISPLQHGGFYYLVRTTISASPLIDKLDNSSNLLAPGFPYQI